MKVILLAVAVVTLAVGLLLCSVGISEALGAQKRMWYSFLSVSGHGFFRRFRPFYPHCSSDQL